MTRLAILSCVTVLLIPTLAVGEAVSELDTNGDGVLTLDEVQVRFPELGSDSFTAMDLNADGALDADEVTVAQEAGLMPATDG